MIAEIGPDLPADGHDDVDARGLLALPGVVDGHVHLNDPGRAHWEGFATGTAALAAGGTTTAIDMPLNAIPPTIDGAAFDAKVAAAQGRLHVDVALWGGLVPGDLDRLDELAAAGVVGFKAFMSASGVEEFPAADDAHAVRGHGPGRRARAAGRGARGERRDHRGLWPPAPWPRAARPCATTSPRGRSSAETAAIGAGVALARRPAARCTSSTSARAAAWRSWPRRAPAAST